MLFAVVQTHRLGVRLSREEVAAAEPLPGKLLISDWREGNAAGRALRVAYLKHPTKDFYPNVIQPLFEPSLVRMTNSGFLLVGIQIDEAAGTIAHFEQGWWVRNLEITTGPNLTKR